MRRRWFFVAPAAISALLLFIAFVGWIVEQLWNTLLPPLFGLPALTFLQAVGILMLGRILFGGFGFHGGGPRSHFRRRMLDRMADRMADRWQAMTPEERERFQQKMRERCGFDPSAGESKGQ